MSGYYLEKEFYDYADDIEGVNIHYAWTPLGESPHWEQERITRFMPLVRVPFRRIDGGGITVFPSGTLDADEPRLRKKVLKLPEQIRRGTHGGLTDTYLLHYYFEVFQGGHRYNSPLFTEEIVTGAGSDVIPSQRAEVTEPVGTITVD